MVFEITVVNDYLVATTTQAFVQGAPWNSTIAQCLADDQFQYFDTGSGLAYAQRNANGWEQLDNAACIKTYGQKQVTNWANVLVVTEDPPSYNETVLNVVMNLSEDSAIWVCNGPEGGAKFCQDPQDVSNAADWVAPVSLASDGSWDCGLHVNETLPVKYCLAQPVPEECRIGVIPSILIIVLICNLVKIIGLAWTIWRLNFEPLVTLGDAVASFLNHPDSTSSGFGAMSIDDIKRWDSNSDQSSASVWKAKARTGFAAASGKRWLICSVL